MSEQESKSGLLLFQSIPQYPGERRTAGNVRLFYRQLISALLLSPISRADLRRPANADLRLWWEFTSSHQYTRSEAHVVTFVWTTFIQPTGLSCQW
ncbi:hypothetical protein KC340_g124 [Hortaea werneckii]|nr:hypothetical protein KC340_g124 [Hortaea werneckii]